MQPPLLILEEATCACAVMLTLDTTEKCVGLAPLERQPVADFARLRRHEVGAVEHRRQERRCKANGRNHRKTRGAGECAPKVARPTKQPCLPGPNHRRKCPIPPTPRSRPAMLQTPLSHIPWLSLSLFARLLRNRTTRIHPPSTSWMALVSQRGDLCLVLDCARSSGFHPAIAP